MTMRFERVPKEKLKLRPQVRHHTPESLRRLADSLLLGQLQTCGANKDYTLIWGNGRKLAADLEPKITHLLVAIFDEPMTEQEFLRKQAVENLCRTDLSNADKCKIAVEYAKSAPGMTLRQIAADFSVDASHISRWMSWERCVAAVQEALAADTITLTQMYSISQLPQEQQEAALAELRNGKKSAAKSNGVRRSTVKCQMPSGMVVTLAGEGVTLAGVIEAFADLLKAARKANDEGLDVKTWEKVLRDKSRAS